MLEEPGLHELGGGARENAALVLRRRRRRERRGARAVRRVFAAAAEAVRLARVRVRVRVRVVGARSGGHRRADAADADRRGARAIDAGGRRRRDAHRQRHVHVRHCEEPVRVRLLLPLLPRHRGRREPHRIYKWARRTRARTSALRRPVRRVRAVLRVRRRHALREARQTRRRPLAHLRVQFTILVQILQ